MCPVLTPGSDGGDVGELEEGGKMGVGKEEVNERVMGERREGEERNTPYVVKEIGLYFRLEVCG